MIIQNTKIRYQWKMKTDEGDNNNSPELGASGNEG